MDDLIKKIPPFGGTAHEDVVQWLNIIDQIFDHVQLQPSNRYIAAQYYLTQTAALWFKYSRSTVSNWSTFRIEIVKAFQPTFSSRFSSSSSTTPQTQPQKHSEHDYSHELDSVPGIKTDIHHAVEPDIDPDFEFEVKLQVDNDTGANVNPDTDAAADFESHQHSADEPYTDSITEPDVNPDFAPDASCDTRPDAESDDTLRFETVPQTVVGCTIRLTTDDSEIHSISSLDVQYSRHDKHTSRKFYFSKLFRSSSHGYSYNVSSSGLVSFHTVHHKWRYKYKRVHGSRCIFQHEKHNYWAYLRRWKYRR